MQTKVRVTSMQTNLKFMCHKQVRQVKKKIKGLSVFSMDTFLHRHYTYVKGTNNFSKHGMGSE